jgi:undecaprenyl-diphosphatase
MFKIILPSIFLILILTSCKNSKTDAKIYAADTLSAQKEIRISSEVNPFDLYIINICQKFSRTNQFVDELFVFISKHNSFKGGVIMIAFWWLWFPSIDEDKRTRRVKIIMSLLSGFVAILIARILVLSLPFRLRPINNPDLHLVLPYGTENMGLDELSSFPSDHAILFFAIATGLFFVSKKAGIIAFLYTIIFITFSRVYLCYHYATDVIAGAVIGILVSYFICHNRWMLKFGELLYGFSIKKPQFFYPVFFIITYALSNLFNDLRAAVSFIIHAF